MRWYGECLVGTALGPDHLGWGLKRSSFAPPPSRPGSHPILSGGGLAGSGGRGRRAVPKALPEEPPASPLLRLMPGVRTDKLAKPRDGLVCVCGWVGE